MNNSNPLEIRYTTKNNELLQKRREQLLRSAVKLFVARGFDRVTLNEIAVSARISKGTIYNYIGKKEDLITLIQDSIYADFNSKIKNNIKKTKEMNWADVLYQYIKAYLELMDKKRDSINFLNNIVSRVDSNHRKRILSTRTETFSYFESVLKKGNQAGEFDVNDPKMMGHNIVRILTSWATNYWYLSKIMDLDEFIKIETEFLFKALGIAMVPSQFKNITSEVGNNKRL